MNWYIFIIAGALIVLGVIVFVINYRKPDTQLDAVGRYISWYKKDYRSEKDIAEHLKSLKSQLTHREFDKLSDWVYGNPSEFANWVSARSEKDIDTWLKSTSHFLPRHHKALEIKVMHK